MNATPSQPERLILFDGICAVCDAGMTWLMDHDPAGRLHYAPLQGDTARAVLARHPEIPENIDSIVFVDRTQGVERVSFYSDAIFDIAAVLAPPWRALRLLRWIPRPLRDLGYRAFAAIRYRVFGTLDACRIPTEAEAERMLP